MSYIGTNAGGFVCAGRDGKIYIKNFYEDTEEIPLRLFKTYEFGEEYQISKVSYEDGIRSFKIGDDTRNTLWISQDNMFIIDGEQVQEIYNKLRDLTVTSFEGTVIINPALDIGDRLIINGKTVIYQGEITFNGRFVADIKSKISIKEKQETTVKTESQKSINRKVRSEINQLDGEIKQLVQEQEEYNNKIVEVTQSLDGIKEQVKNVMDFTREQTAGSTLHLNDCANGNGYIIEMSIRDIKYLTPTVELVPSDYLVPFGDYFTLVVDKDRYKKTSEAFETVIQLKKSLNRLNSNIYDEININEKGEINLIRRIGENANGSLYKLEKETVELLGNVVLPTFESDTYIYVKETPNVNMYAKYIIKSDFSSVYARKVELDTAIEQTNTTIMQEVNRKVNDEDFGTKIVQDFESVKIAWNQISEFIKFITENNKAILAILNNNNQKITTFDSTGQHFFDNDKVIADMGIIDLANDENDSYTPGLFFTLDTSQLDRGAMGWAYKTILEDGTVKYTPYIWMGKRGDRNDVNLFVDVPLILENRSIEFNNASISDNDIGLEMKIYKTLNIVDSYENDIFKIVKNNNGNFEMFFLNGTEKLASLYKNQSNSYTLDLHGGYVNNILNLPTSNDIDYITGVESDYICFEFRSGGHVYIYNNVSDVRLKKNIQNSTINALDVIEKIQHRKFDWKKNNKHENIGYIAQELEKIDPNYIHKTKLPNKDDYDYQINLLSLLATSTKAIQELNSKVEEQQEQINLLKQEINILKERNFDNGKNSI